MEWQRNQYCRVETRSGTSLDPEIGNTRMDSGQTERQGQDTGNQLGRTGELLPKIELLG